jgi:hypothetical protein
MSDTEQAGSSIDAYIASVEPRRAAVRAEAVAAVEWWLPFYEFAASLEPDQLVFYVAGLAKRVQVHRTSHVDELTIAARVLERRYATRKASYPLDRRSNPRLGDTFVDHPQKPAQKQVGVHVLTRCDQFASATYAQVAGWFTRWGRTLDERVGTSAMKFFPETEPDDVQARIVLYGTLTAGPGPLLYRTAGSPEWNKAVDHLLSRVGAHMPFPWEPGGWDGD